MPPSRSRTSRRRAFAIATAVFTLSFAGVGITIDRRNDEAQRRIEAHLERLRTEREARDFARPAVWGQTLDGAAWPHYEEALAIADRASERRQDFIAAQLVQASPEEAALRDELLAEFGDALDHVRAGAHLRDATVELDWNRGVGMRIPKLSNTRTLYELALLKLLVAGTVEEEIDAVRSLLDVQQLGRDLAHTPLLICEMIGLDALVVPALSPHLAGALPGRISREAKEEWLAGLRVLEGAVEPGSVALSGELETFAQTFVTDRDALRGEGLGPIDSRLVRWREALFLRAEVAEHLELVSAAIPGIENAYALPGEDAQVRLEAIRGSLDAAKNRITEAMSGAPRSAMFSRMSGRARLSFLRRALELHLGVAGEDPLDVYGTGVSVERSGGTVRIETSIPGETGSGGVLELTLGS